MPRLSQTLHFLQSPSFRQSQSALIGQLTQCIVIGRTPQGVKEWMRRICPSRIALKESARETVSSAARYAFNSFFFFFFLKQETVRHSRYMV